MNENTKMSSEVTPELADKLKAMIIAERHLKNQGMRNTAGITLEARISLDADYIRAQRKFLQARDAYQKALHLWMGEEAVQ